MKMGIRDPTNERVTRLELLPILKNQSSRSRRTRGIVRNFLT